MQAIIDAIREGTLTAEPVVVISNNSQSTALERARREKIDYYHLSEQNYATADDLDTAILETLMRYQVDLVILAGYMKKIGPKTLAKFGGKILNIHPALLPKFGGKGMYGKRVHQAVLEAKEEESGVTVHVIDDQYDNGPILAQTRVPVKEDDTPDTLAERVLKQEHILYADTISKIVTGEIKL